MVSQHSFTAIVYTFSSFNLNDTDTEFYYSGNWHFIKLNLSIKRSYFKPIAICTVVKTEMTTSGPATLPFAVFNQLLCFCSWIFMSFKWAGLDLCVVGFYRQLLCYRLRSLTVRIQVLSEVGNIDCRVEENADCKLRRTFGAKIGLCEVRDPSVKMWCMSLLLLTEAFVLSSLTADTLQS
jgi:hypothetical protein